MAEWEMLLGNVQQYKPIDTFYRAMLAHDTLQKIWRTYHGGISEKY